MTSSARTDEGTAAAPAASETRQLLESCGALLADHFQLSSGLHSRHYVQCARLLEEPRRARRMGELIAERLRPHRIDSVLSPALGGVVIGHEVAAALEVPFRFTERRGGVMELRRGFELRPGERVAIVEDVVTTGKSTLETARLAELLGARVAAVAAIIDRTGGESPFEVPFVALLPLELVTWPPARCPLCAAGGQVVKPGSRGNA